MCDLEFQGQPSRSTVKITWFSSTLISPTSEMLESTPRSTSYHCYFRKQPVLFSNFVWLPFGVCMVWLRVIWRGPAYLSPLFLVAVICALLPWVPWSSHLVGLLRSVSVHLLLHVRVRGTCFLLIYGQLILAFKPSVRDSRLSSSIPIFSSSLTLRLSDSCLFLADHVLRSIYESM